LVAATKSERENMHLKKHPKIKDWPPVWSSFYAGNDKLPIGDEGTLKDVTIVKDSRLPPHKTPDFLKLTIEYEGNTFEGSLRSDDPNFVELLCERLKGCIGTSIQEVGNLDLGF
jgi:hypothetical protein